MHCQKSTQDGITPIVEDILHNKASFFYLDTKSYPNHDKSLPIGVFDSGTGGLTVLDAIVQFDQFVNGSNTWNQRGDGIRDFQKEYFIYLADQANMPYGQYSSLNKTDLLKEHIIKDVQFLLGKKYYLSGDEPTHYNDKSHVKAIVIACNTATAYGKDDIVSFMERSGLNIKVIGVIDAGVRSALTQFEQSEDGSVAIFATAGTVASEGYVKTLHALKTAMNHTGDIHAFQQAGIGLAGAIDGSAEYIAPGATLPRTGYKGPSETHPEARIDLTILNRYGFDWNGNKMLFDGDAKHPENIQINDVENYIAYHLVSLLEKMKGTSDTHPLKAVILGCTHYPFYTKIFQEKYNRLYNYQENGQYIYRAYLKEQIAWIDPALNTAKELYEYLSQQAMFNDKHLNLSEFYISVPNLLNSQIEIDASGQFTFEYKYERVAGYIQEYVKRVPFSKKTISPETLHRLSNAIPLVFDMIGRFNHTNPKTEYLQPEERIIFNSN